MIIKVCCQCPWIYWWFSLKSLGRPKFDATIQTNVFLRLDVKKIILSVGEDPGSRIIGKSIQFLNKLPICKTCSSPINSSSTKAVCTGFPSFWDRSKAVWRVVFNSSPQILAPFRYRLLLKNPRSSASQVAHRAESIHPQRPKSSLTSSVLASCSSSKASLVRIR